MIVIHFWIPIFGLAINFSYNLCLVAQFSGCHLQVGRGIVLFAAGFGQSVSRGSQGVGDSLLIPERDKERAKGRGERNLLTYNRWKELREEIGEKHASFCYFSSKESRIEEGQMRANPAILHYMEPITNMATIM